MSATVEELVSEPVRLIGADGCALRHPEYRADLPDELVVRAYELMVTTRELDNEYVNLQRQGQLALYASCRGQEAAQVGCALALRDTDWLFPQYRELGVFVTRGVDPAALGQEWRGTAHGGRGLLEHRIAPIAISVGTHALHAVGSAMANVRLNDGGVSVAFVGDGATSEGDVHEALNFASVFHVPFILYVQNNQWAISVPASRQFAAPSIAQRAAGYGMRGVQVDGNDMLACYAVVADAARRARAGEGPTLVEAVTYRLGAHTTSDDPRRYRSDDEVAEWEAREPIGRLRAYLQWSGLWSESLDEQTRANAARIRGALRVALVDAPDPDPVGLFGEVFSSPTPELDDQAAQLASEHDVHVRAERPGASGLEG
jgi:pyruvate dehydrogenase E1 component alpha subunit